jgi:hypothetical protein
VELFGTVLLGAVLFGAVLFGAVLLLGAVLFGDVLFGDVVLFATVLLAVVLFGVVELVVLFGVLFSSPSHEAQAGVAATAASAIHNKRRLGALIGKAPDEVFRHNGRGSWKKIQGHSPANRSRTSRAMKEPIRDMPVTGPCRGRALEMIAQRARLFLE